MEQQQKFEDTIPALKEFLKQYNKITEICFSDCIHEFSTRKVINSEDTCVINCIEKYLKMNQRIGQRFQEQQLLSNENRAATEQRSGFF